MNHWTPNIDSSPVTLDQESKPQYTSGIEYSKEESDPENLAEELALFLHIKPQTPLSPILRARNPFIMSNQPSTLIIALTMTAPATKPHKLKLGQPSVFDVDLKKSRAWINNAQIYLLVNKEVYNHDNKKIAYVLSFMTKGSAGLWALTKTESALARNPKSFGSWNDFLLRFNTSFILENTKDQAIAWLSTTKTSDKIPLLKYISKFKNNMALSRINNEDALINFFSWGTPTQIMRKIYSMDTVPDTIEKWYTQALPLKHVWEKANDIVKGWGNPFLTFLDNWNNYNQKNTQKKKDPNAMDIDAIWVEKLTPEERQRCIDNNLWFKCWKPRHSAIKCRNPFTNRQRLSTATTTKIEEIPDDNDSATVGRISTMDF